jgi:mannosylglucosylglycerate synthase
MKIAFIHYSAAPVVGGVESVIQHQARLAAAYGNEVCIIAGRGEQVENGIRFILNPLLDSRHPDILEVKKDLDVGRVLANFDNLVKRIRLDLEQLLQGVEVVIIHNVASLNKNLVLTAALKQISELPHSPGFILWHHDLAWTTTRYAQELHEGFPWDLLRVKWENAIQVVISELRQKELCHLMGIPKEEVYIVPNGLDIPRFLKLEEPTSQLINKLDLLSADPMFLLPVRITPRKNIEMALRILGELKKYYPLAALVVTGPLGPHNPANAEYFKKLVKLRKELGLEENAYFLAELVEGYLPDEVIADFYRLADALILPSFEEGFGIPLLEAGLSHLPIFCSDIAPLKAIGGDWVTYFSVEESPQVVAKKIFDQMSESSVSRLSVHVRTRYEWKRIYIDKIEPLVQLAKRRAK